MAWTKHTRLTHFKQECEQMKKTPDKTYKLKQIVCKCGKHPNLTLRGITLCKDGYEKFGIGDWRVECECGLFSSGAMGADCAINNWLINLLIFNQDGEFVKVYEEEYIKR